MFLRSQKCSANNVRTTATFRDPGGVKYSEVGCSPTQAGDGPGQGEEDDGQEEPQGHQAHLGGGVGGGGGASGGGWFLMWLCKLADLNNLPQFFCKVINHSSS